LILALKPGLCRAFWRSKTPESLNAAENVKAPEAAG
jgi:hypothetical protein